MPLPKPEPMIDAELDMPGKIFQSGRSRRCSPMEKVFTTFAVTGSVTDAKTIQAAINDLQNRADRATEPVEAMAQASLKAEVRRLRALLIQTTAGVAAIDILAPRLDTGFLKKGRYQWSLGWFPRFAVFNRQNSSCCFRAKTISLPEALITSDFGEPAVSLVVRSDCNQSLLDEAFKLLWLIRPKSIFKENLLQWFGPAVLLAVYGVAVGTTFDGINAAIFWLIAATVICLAIAWFRRQPRDFVFETHMPKALSAEIQILLPRLEEEFDNVYLIAPAIKWHERTRELPALPTGDADLLVAVRRDDIFWVAAYEFSGEKKQPPQIFLSSLETAAGSLQRIKKLSLSGASTTDEELGREIDSLEDPTKIRQLDLGGASITDKSLAILSRLTNLETLYLESTRITDAGLVHLQNLRNLRKLDLTNTEITDNGIRSLGGISWLQELAIDFTAVTDVGFGRLEDLKDLESLSCRGTAITDAGLLRISNILSLQTLTIARESQVTVRGLHDFHGWSPRCRVIQLDDVLV